MTPKDFKKNIHDELSIYSGLLEYILCKVHEMRNETGLSFSRKTKKMVHVYGEKKGKPVFRGSPIDCLNFLVMEWKNGRTAAKMKKPAKPSTSPTPQNKIVSKIKRKKK